MSWRKVKLSEIFDIARGGSPRPIDSYLTDAPDAINWISIKDASESGKYIRSTKLKIKPEGASKSRLVKPGDFLLTNSMSFGRPYIMQTTGCIHDGWLVLSDKSGNVDPDFLYYLLGSPQMYKEFAKRAAGAVVKNLNIDLVKGVSIPLPPLEVQKKIAAVLEKADTLRRKREEQIKRLDDLLQATFLDMFGDPVTNPKGWNTDTLGSLSNSITDGKHGDCNNDNNSGYFFISAKDIHDGMIDYSKARQIVKKEFEEVHRRTNLQVNDLVIVNTGSIGKMAIVKPDPRTRQTTFQKSVAIVKPKHEILNVYYLKTLFEIVLKDIVNASSGSTLKNLLLSRMRELTLLVPPVHFQREYEDFVLKSNKILDALTKSLQRQEHLFNSLMQRAFKGELELK